MNIKKIFRNTLLLIGVLFLSILNIKDIKAAEQIPFYSKAIRDVTGQVRFQYSIKGKVANFVKIMRYDNNDIAYCIEPTKEILDFSQGKYDHVDDDTSILDISKLTSETFRKLRQISFYGFGYESHTDDSWYVSTQLEIWNTISPNCCTLAKGDSSLIERQRQEIRNLVNRINTLPNFNGNSHTQIVGKSAEYIDTNNVLKEYKVSGCDNCEAKIDDNKLIVKGLKVGTGKISLERIVSNRKNPSVLYYNGEYQKLMQFGSPDPLKMDINLNIIGGTLKIQKVDKDTGLFTVQGDGSFEGAEYTIYDFETREIVGVITTNKSGYGELTIGMGKYIVKETKAPKGYLLSDEEFVIEFTLDHTEENLQVKEQVIKGHALLTKMYGDDEKGYVLEEGAEFEIYNSKGDLVTTLTTDEDGVAVADLVFGEYTIHQTKGKDKFLFIDDIKLNITEDGKIYKFTAKNLSYPRLEIMKKDKSNNQSIKDVTIEIYKYNEEIDSYEIYYMGVTDKDGKISLTGLDLGKYYYIEKKAPEGYLLNTEKHYFEISEYGKTYYFELFNEKIKGELEFTKTDFSTGEPLPNTLIEIYNADTNELIFSGKTDENGKIIIKDLVYGNYYLIEKEAPDGYILNPEPMKFEIKENGEIVKVEMTNEKIVEVPDTGLSNINHEVVGSLVLIISGLGLISYGLLKKKRK